ncbi:MAG: hemolysin family protein [Bacteroidetes bacterium]|nr:hemolysin family protein [Bacteroidota bacterium]
MEIDWYYNLSLLLISLMFSALFSGSEVALFSLDSKKIKEIKSETGILKDYILLLLEAPKRLLVTILLGNTIFNVAASIISVSMALQYAKYFGLSVDLMLVIQIVLLTIIILIFGEITPKVWASKNPYRFAKIVSFPLYWISIIIYPVSKIITDLIKYFASKIHFDKSKTAIHSSELSEFADIVIEKGVIEEEEHGIIHGLVNFKSVSVREIMTPRVDIVAIPIDSSYDEVIKKITDSGHSRLPLFSESLDNIIGIIYAKDLLPYIGDEHLRKNFFLRKIARQAMFIPESKLISDLMKEFLSKNMHMGIVVDEYGGTAGLISLEDILEEIVGEIRDEYDVEEEEITKLDANKYLVLGKVPIDELNDLFDYHFDSETDDFETVGGFLFMLAGSIPNQGDKIVYENFRFTVKEVINKRINKVLIERITDDSV